MRLGFYHTCLNKVFLQNMYQNKQIQNIILIVTRTCHYHKFTYNLYYQIPYFTTCLSVYREPKSAKTNLCFAPFTMAFNKKDNRTRNVITAVKERPRKGKFNERKRRIRGQRRGRVSPVFC